MEGHKNYPKLILICIACIMVAFFASNRLFRGDLAGWKLIIASDGLGYYAYLPAIFIDHDLTYNKVTERESKILGYKRYVPGYLEKFGDKVVNKYFSGEALLLLPFFLLGTFFSWISGIEISGYSFFFQLFIGLGALFYLLLGLYYLRKILQYFRIEPILISIVLVAILFGTNLFYYSMWQPCMSHVYSFFAINGFLWYSCRAIQHPQKKYFFLSVLFLGFTVLIRPTNGIVVLLLPFLFSSIDEIKALLRFLWEKKITILLFFVAFLVVVSIQPVLWYIQTGRFFIWSYKDEGFIFRHPQVSNVLFGYRKGLFIYTPLIFLCLLGIIRLVFQKLHKTISIVIFLIISTYIISSWWNWYYGDSFGARAFIDYYGIFAILLAMLLSYKENKLRNTLIIILLFPFIALNLLQTWQYSHYIINPNSMNKAKYDYVFLQTDSTYQNCLGGNDEIPGYSMDIAHPCKLFQNDFEKPTEDWRATTVATVHYAHSGARVGYLDSLHQYSTTLQIQPEKLAKLPALFYIEANVWIRDSVKGASNKAFFVISMDSIDVAGNYWYGFRVNDIPDNPPGVWRHCRFALTLPKFRVPYKTLKIYIWDSGKKPFMIDDFSIEFFREKGLGTGH
jgi:hypothetical protein